MKPAITVWDIDGVLADFCLAFSGLGNKYFGTPVISTYQHTVWDEFPGMTALMVDHCWEHVNKNPSFWGELTPLVGKQTFLDIDELSLTGRVYFATNRKNGKYETERWLKGYGVTNPTVVLTPRKGEFARAVGATYLIDDKSGNSIYTAYHTPGCNSYILDRAYNRFDAGVIGSRVRRVTSVEQFISDVREGK